MISQADVIKEVSKRTGYRKVDIKAVMECFEERRAGTIVKARITNALRKKFF